MSAERFAWGQTLFCDDIRYEIGGKRSLIGMYQGELIISGDFPAVLPRLVIFVIYNEIKDALSADLSLQVYFPNDDKIPSVLIDIPKAQTKSVPGSFQDPDTEIVMRVEAPVIVSPIELACEGDIKVRMVSGSVTTRLGRLHVRKYRDDEATLFDPTASLRPSEQSPPDAPAS